VNLFGDFLLVGPILGIFQTDQQVNEQKSAVIYNGFCKNTLQESRNCTLEYIHGLHQGAVRGLMCSGYVYLQGGPFSGTFLHLLVVIFVGDWGVLNSPSKSLSVRLSIF